MKRDEPLGVFKFAFTSRGLDSYEIPDKLRPSRKRVGFLTFGVSLKPAGSSELDVTVPESAHTQLCIIA